MNDQKYMNLAYKQALRAASQDEVPIGAVLVDKDGLILARGYNKVEQKKSQLVHAEMIVLQKATKKVKDWRLLDVTLFVTLQPCLMCLGALYLSRVCNVVYGVESAKFGARFDFDKSCGIYKNLPMKERCLQDQKSQELLQQFFKKKRRKEGEQKDRSRKSKERITCSKKRA